MTSPSTMRAKAGFRAHGLGFRAPPLFQSRDSSLKSHLRLKGYAYGAEEATT